MDPNDAFDTIVIGAGIAGASLAWRLAAHGRTLLVEREDQPGYHTTGRSAAQYIASYGPPLVRALTIASRPFFSAPPAGFATQPILTPRAMLTVSLPGQETLLDETWQTIHAAGGDCERITAAAAIELVPVLRPDRVTGAVIERDSYDMDVDVLHQGFLRGLRRAGGTLASRAEVTALARDGARWVVVAGDRRYSAAVVVNAAGAWCDRIAALAGAKPIGLVPKRRAAMIFDPPPGVATDHWPLVAAADHSFYFKPDAGRLLGSPANEDETDPQDVQPEELDIATAMYRIEENTTMVVRPIRTWAGLRSFVGDGEMVAGFDATLPGFFWCAGQGGYGIQTAPAMSEVCADLVLGRPIATEIARLGVTAERLAPGRCQAGAGPVDR
ncbi:MAG: FAD-binding oxidoreductase [Burkholderiaceae bacterium]